MKRKRFTEVQIIGVLKESEAGAKTDDICRRHGISSATFYSWRKKYGGMEAGDAKRLRPVFRAISLATFEQRFWDGQAHV